MSDMSYIATNVRRIRLQKQLTQAHVAESAKLSRIAYLSIESGKSIPRPDSVARIAAALGVDVKELSSTQSRQLEAVRFRSQKKMKSRDQVLVDVGRWLEGYNELQAASGEPRAEFKLKGLASMAPHHLAAAARDKLGIGPNEPIRDICGLMDFAGVRVFPYESTAEGFFGLSVGAEDGGPAVVVNTWSRLAVERWIFTAAHELGHLLMHLGGFRNEEDAEVQGEEAEADRFASHFLMPEELFWRRWEDAAGLPFVERVLAVKRYFRVSYKAVLYRLAPHYDSIWMRFNWAYSRGNRPPLSKHEEPDKLAPSEFVERRLAALARKAIEGNKVRPMRAAEILRITESEMNARLNEWAEETISKEGARMM